MLCPQCNSENREQARFCVKCGARLLLACPLCGTELPPSAQFCDVCGAQVDALTQEAVERPDAPTVEALKRLIPKEFAERLLATRGHVPHERRTVTFLFSDVRGSSAMTAGLDPEDVMDILNGALDVLIEPVYRYEGTLADLEGDGILAFFGAPIAHEDDPERACRAALDITAGARRYAEQLERERGIAGFDVRVGISTGLVVVGEVGSDLRVEYTASGDAIWIAKRLQTAAAPGTVLITEETQRLIAQLFETQALDRIQIKGKAEPIPVYRVLAAKELLRKPRGVEGLESPLVGREAEFAALQEALRRLQAGVGGIVTLVGEAGIGKSRLVAELRKQVGPDTQWVEGRCLSYGRSMAYLLWLDVLRGVVGTSVGDAPEVVAKALGDWVRTVCPDRFDDVYPYLGRAMALPLEEEQEAVVAGLGSDRLKGNTFEAVKTLVESASQRRPLAVVFDDLHWADPTSIELLEALLPLTDGMPLLLICVFRPDTEHGCWRIKELAARLYGHRHTDLWIAPLSEGDSEALLGNLLQVKEVIKAFCQRVLAQAEGNPFYVEEILRSLIDHGVLARDEAGGDWRVTQDLVDIPIPETLQGVLVSRIDRLPQGTKRVLQTASVIGRIFPYRLLQAVVGDGQELEAHLLKLQREQMIRERARLPELEYIFKHQLTEEAAYSGLLKKQRRALHCQVAQVLEQSHSGRAVEQAAILAHHWRRAGEPLKAIDYLLQAGDHARQLGASPEAVSFYQEALAEASMLKTPESDAQLASIHDRLGDVYVESLSLHDEGLMQYTQFLQLAESQEDMARGERKVAVIHLLRGELDEAQQYYEQALERLKRLPPLAESSRVRCGLAYLLVYKNQLAEATAHARASLEASTQIDDVRGQADAHNALGIVASYQGVLKQASKHFEQALGLYRQIGDLPRLAKSCNNVGDCCRRLGHMARALEHLREGVEVAHRIGDTRDESLLLQTQAELLFDQGRWEDGIASLDAALALAEQSGVAERIIEVHTSLGLAHESLGQLAAARHHLDTADRLNEQMEHQQLRPRIYLGLARVSAAEGNMEQAARLVRLAEECAGSDASSALQAELHSTQAVLCEKNAEWDAAAAHLEKSLELVKEGNLQAEVAKTQLHLGEVLARRRAEGDKGRARDLLLGALSTFRQLEALGYVTQVEAALGTLV